jgi:hypothetical protein
MVVHPLQATVASITWRSARLERDEPVHRPRQI